MIDWTAIAAVTAIVTAASAGIAVFVRTENKVIAVRLNAVDKRLERMDAILDRLAEGKGRMDLIDERLLAEGKRMDALDGRMNKFIDTDQYKVRHEELEKRLSRLEAMRKE